MGKRLKGQAGQWARPHFGEKVFQVLALSPESLERDMGIFQGGTGWTGFWDKQSTICPRDFFGPFAWRGPMEREGSPTVKVHHPRKRGSIVKHRVEGKLNLVGAGIRSRP